MEVWNKSWIQGMLQYWVRYLFYLFYLQSIILKQIIQLCAEFALCTKVLVLWGTHRPLEYKDIDQILSDSANMLFICFYCESCNLTIILIFLNSHFYWNFPQLYLPFTYSLIFLHSYIQIIRSHANVLMANNKVENILHSVFAKSFALISARVLKSGLEIGLNFVCTRFFEERRGFGFVALAPTNSPARHFFLTSLSPYFSILWLRKPLVLMAPQQ